MQTNSNNHEYWRERLVEYLYQECTEAEAATFDAHLRECQDCRRDVAEFGALRNRLQAWQIEEYPHVRVEVKPAFLPALSQAMKLLPLWGRALATAGAALVLLALFNLDFRAGGADGFRVHVSLVPARWQRAGAGENRAPLDVSADRQQILAEANQLIEKSEARRAQELEVKLTQLREQLLRNGDVNLAKWTDSLRKEQKLELLQFRRELAIASGDFKFSDLSSFLEGQSR